MNCINKQEAKLKKSGFPAAQFILLLISGMLVFGILFVQAEQVGDQSPETAAMDEVKSDQTMGEVEMGGNIKGVVTAVNPAGGVLAVRDDDEDDKIYYISVKKATTYAGFSSIADLNPGDSISVDCYGLEGHLVAETITIEDRASQKDEPETLEKVLVD
jgi:hypothetical protein